MFSEVFIVLIIVLHITAKLPSYIHVCGLKDPNYDQCVAKNIENVRDKFCTGFPEFNISEENIKMFDKIVIFDTNNIKLYLKVADAQGLCDFVLNSVHADFERLKIDIDVLFPRLSWNATYDFALHLLVPVSHKGPIVIVTENMTMKINIDLKRIIKNNKEHIFVSKVNNRTHIKSFTYKFTDDRKELAQLHAIMSDVINKNEMEIIYVSKSAIEERISRIIISLVNSMARDEEIFPEET